MAERARKNSSREALILAGIREIEQNGIRKLSLRRVAQACGVSCAAPFKHFKDKQDFIHELLLYTNDRWHERQRAVIEQFPEDIRAQLISIILEYIRFMAENPYFVSMIIAREEAMDSVSDSVKHKLSSVSKQLIRDYCEKTRMDAETEKRKTFVMRSIIFGAAFLFTGHELEYNEKNMDFIRTEVIRVFDAP